MATGETVVMIALSIMMYQVSQTFKKACFVEEDLDYIDAVLIDSERAHFEPNFEESLFFY